jgi:hypothetical protein
MRALTFHAGYGKLNFEASCDFRYAICVRSLLASQELELARANLHRVNAALLIFLLCSPVDRHSVNRAYGKLPGS